METTDPGPPADIIIENERDRRALLYLMQVCGSARVAHARALLPGRSRPYVSNIAKMLGVTIPESVQITPREEGRRKLAELKEYLANQSESSRHRKK